MGITLHALDTNSSNLFSPKIGSQSQDAPLSSCGPVHASFTSPKSLMADIRESNGPD